MIAAKPAPPLTIGPLTLTDLVRYQGASGDFNPIHHDRDRAEQAGLGTIIAPGMLSAGFLSSWLLGWVPRRNVRAFSIRFQAPVKLGDTLTLHGTVAGTIAGTGAGESPTLTRVELTCTNQSGVVVTTGVADVLLSGE
jgi:acyl dehydratase